MCKCQEPVRHKCGRFGEYVGTLSVDDVYWCIFCEVNFTKRCELLMKNPEGVQLVYRGVEGGD